MASRRSPLAQALDELDTRILVYKAYFDERMKWVGDERERDSEWQAFISNLVLLELLSKRETLSKFLRKPRKGKAKR